MMESVFPAVSSAGQPTALPERDLLITAVEVNDHHGVGILLERLFPDSSSFVTIRTSSLYQGATTFAGSHHELCSRFLSLKETEENLSRILSLYRIRRILCVPYYREEFVHGVLAKKLTQAPLCTYLMDDQNVFGRQVPDRWVARLLADSDLRLGISPEMCLAYEGKYGHRLSLLPPVLVNVTNPVPCYWADEPGEPIRAAMLGNVWTDATLTRLRNVMRESGLQIDWYGNGPKASWLEGTPDDWERDGIRCLGHLPEADLVAALAGYPFIVIPSGTMAEDDDNPAFSRLSLPSRLLFCHARVDTPVLVLGSPDTPAGRLVRTLNSGMCADYTTDSLLKASKMLANHETRTALRAAVRRIARQLVLPSGGRWIWETLQSGPNPPAPFQQPFATTIAPPPWLSKIKRFSPVEERPLPLCGQSLSDIDLPAFEVLRDSHHRLLSAEGVHLPPLDEIDLPNFMGATSAYLAGKCLPAGSDLLLLDRHIPPALTLFCPNIRIWQISDLESWQRAGYAGDSRFLKGPEPYPETFPQFDGFVSNGWLGELAEDYHALEGLALYLDACSRTHALHLHFFAAVKNPAHFWQPPAFHYLARRFSPQANAPSLDRVLTTDDTFTLSHQAYDRTWMPTTKRTQSEYGSPLGLMIWWRRGDRLK